MRIYRLALFRNPLVEWLLLIEKSCFQNLICGICSVNTTNRCDPTPLLQNAAPFLFQVTAISLRYDFAVEFHMARLMLRLS